MILDNRKFAAPLSRRHRTVGILPTASPHSRIAERVTQIFLDAGYIDRLFIYAKIVEV